MLAPRADDPRRAAALTALRAHPEDWGARARRAPQPARPAPVPEPEAPHRTRTRKGGRTP
jgi:hypothetical protein